MTNSRSSLPFQFTFGRPNWRFQIHQNNNQQIILSQWLQGQGQQQHRTQMDEAEPIQSIMEGQTNNSSLSEEVAVDITTPPEDLTRNLNPQNDPSSLLAPSSNNPPPRTQSNPFSAINLFLEQNPELYSVFQTLLTYIPFVVLILFKEVYKHTSDILVIVALVVTFFHANNTIQREVSKQGKRELVPLAVVVLNTVACLWFVYFMCGEKELYHSLLLFPANSAPLTLSNLLWTVTTTDHILKLGTVSFKAVLTAFPLAVFPMSRRGKCFVFTERTSQLYRAVAAVPPWIHYLLNNQSNESSSFFFYDSLIGICLCVIYLTCKAYKAIKLIKKWKISVTKLFQSTTYGAHPTNEQLQTAGPICPICHDSYRKPIFLGCKHVFCEECLAMWLDRERTCPMCRSTVAEDPKWKDGSTAYLVQLF